jgi:hypothetical protein
MRLRESVTAVLVAVGAASAFATWSASVNQDTRGDRLASLREPASQTDGYRIGVSPGLPGEAREIVVRNEEGKPVYVSNPATATTTVMRGTVVPKLDNPQRPARSSLERAYASADGFSGKGDRLPIAAR